MDDTPESLLERIRDPQDDASWREFAGIYIPVVQAYVLRAGVPAHTVDDLVQDVLLAVANAIPSFTYDRSRGRFRSWLRTITRHRFLRWRSERQRDRVTPSDQAMLEAHADDVADLDRFWEERWRERVLEYGLSQAAKRVDARTYEAFRRYVMLDQSAAEVAESLGMTTANVYVCKTRVLGHIREAVADMDTDE